MMRLCLLAFSAQLALGGRYPKAAYKKSPSLDGVDKKQWCIQTQKRHGVIPDLTWGTLPKSQFGSWATHGCNDLVGLGERTKKLQIAPDLKKAAANKAKRPQAYKPFKLLKSEVRAHKWLEVVLFLAV